MGAQVTRSAPAATTWTTVFTASVDCTVNIRVVNRDLLNAITYQLCIGLTTGATTPPVTDHIEPPGKSMKAGGFLEETGISMQAGESVNIFVSAATVSVRCFGR